MPRKFDGAIAGSQPGGSAPSPGVVAAAAAVLVLATGWFALSWQVGHNPASVAFGEAVGVALGLLILACVVGSIRDRGVADGGDDD
jgi:hypothetical protein